MEKIFFSVSSLTNCVVLIQCQPNSPFTLASDTYDIGAHSLSSLNCNFIGRSPPPPPPPPLCWNTAVRMKHYLLHIFVQFIIKERNSSMHKMYSFISSHCWPCIRMAIKNVCICFFPKWYWCWYNIYLSHECHTDTWISNTANKWKCIQKMCNTGEDKGPSSRVTQDKLSA